jgi:hypothetical protein
MALLISKSIASRTAGNLGKLRPDGPPAVIEVTQNVPIS